MHTRSYIVLRTPTYFYLHLFLESTSSYNLSKTKKKRKEEEEKNNTILSTLSVILGERRESVDLFPNWKPNEGVVSLNSVPSSSRSSFLRRCSLLVRLPNGRNIFLITLLTGWMSPLCITLELGHRQKSTTRYLPDAGERAVSQCFSNAGTRPEIMQNPLFAVLHALCPCSRKLLLPCLSKNA